MNFYQRSLGLHVYDQEFWIFVGQNDVYAPITIKALKPILQLISPIFFLSLPECSVFSLQKHSQEPKEQPP